MTQSFSYTGRRRFLTQALAGTMTLGLPSYVFAQAPADFNGNTLDRLFLNAVSEHEIPGAVAAIGSKGKTIWRGVFGHQALIPHPESMTWHTLFDMASLTKPLITAPSVMQLYEQGKIKLDTPACHYLPDFAAQGKEHITIRHLLTHYSGLQPDLDLGTPWSGKEIAAQLACNAVPQSKAGKKFVYSDINYIVLGLIVEALSGLPLDIYATRHILQPLGLKRSFFRPDPALYDDIAPTQFDENGTMLRGVVHDPTARRMGGVAGHAGLFSCADDIITYAKALLARRAGQPSLFPLSQKTVIMMSTPQQPHKKTDLRGLGWDINTHYSTPRGAVFPLTSFGHTGFTGTSLWLVPETQTFVMILTNRVHPDGKGKIIPLRHDVATEAAIALRQN